MFELMTVDTEPDELLIDLLASCLNMGSFQESIPRSCDFMGMIEHSIIGLVRNFYFQVKYQNNRIEMYEHLLMTHSWLRYIVVILMVWAIIKAYQGSKNGLTFGKMGNRLRLWTVLTSHIQLILGFVLYMKSPLVKTFMKTFKDGTSPADATFFGLYHFIGMTIAVIILTIGSAKAKRKTTDSDKWNTMFLWFLIAFIIIFITIPWPFSPFAQSPWIRTP